MTKLNTNYLLSTNNGMYLIDPLTEMLEDRKVMVFGEVNNELSLQVISQLDHLNKVDKDEPITLFVSGPGGSVTDGETIIDFCKSLSNPIYTIGMGLCASMDALILACAGEKGHRSCLPNTEVMIHQPLGGAQGQATDIIIQAENIKKCRNNINKQLSEATGQTIEKIMEDCERDKYLNAEEAKEYGLIDEVITNYYNGKD